MFNDPYLNYLFYQGMRGNQMPISKSYTDPQVVAAINGCLDLDKLTTLPYELKQRYKELCRANRVKPVCFFEAEGFGLRVYMDESDMNVDESEDDEVSLTSHGSVKKNKIDLHGHWLRCPGRLYEQTVVEEKNYVVADERVVKFVGPNHDIDPGDDESEDGWDCDWKPSRRTGEKFTKTQAEAIAKAVKGIAVRA